MKMKPGEKAEITIAPKYAWKDRAFEAPQGVVPKGATVVYTVELVSIDKVGHTASGLLRVCICVRTFACLCVGRGGHPHY